jgi:hypothetical protein
LWEQLIGKKKRAVIRDHIRSRKEIFGNYVQVEGHTVYCAGGKMETNEMGRACGAYGGG